MRRRTALVAMLLGAIGVLAIGSYATADSGKKNVKTGPMSGYLEGAPGGPVSSSANGSFEGRIEGGQLDIAGATASTYTIATTDSRSTLRALVIATSAAGSGEAITAPTAVVVP